MNLRYLSFFVIATLALVAGCGGSGANVGEVSGTVTFDGKPAPNIIVTFNPVGGGRPSSGVTDAQGKYTLVYSTTDTGAEIGQHQVTISASTEYTDEELNDPKIDLTKPRSPIPKEYAAVTKEVEVQGGTNTIDLTYP